MRGPRQVNIAPCRKMPMQYAETDRQIRHRRWQNQRDDGASADVPYQDGKPQKGEQKCLQIPAPIQRKFTVSSLWNLETPS
ncbi:hypothetical protein E3U47_01380 [Pseudomonas sp. RIT623]|nr:hypothetical protein E3U47_01380 [Pseudomonas sp. RIT623]